MARDLVMALRGLRQLSFEEQLTDTTSAATYSGSPLVVNDPRVLSYQETHQNDELVGGDQQVDVYDKLVACEVTVEIARMRLDLLAALLGSAAVVQAGSTPNETATLTRKTSDEAPYFRVKGLIAYMGSDEASGAYLVTLVKAKVLSHSMAHNQDGYATVTLTMRALGRIYDSVIYELAQYETSPTLSETPDVTAPTISSSSPADGATGVAISVSPTITFSEEIQFNAGDFTLVRVSNDSVVAATVTINGAGTIVTINPDSDISAAEEHYIVVSKNVKDVAGNAIAAAQVINFTTA